MLEFVSEPITPMAGGFDAEAMSRLLRERFDFPEENFLLLTEEEATREGIRRLTKESPRRRRQYAILHRRRRTARRTARAWRRQ